MNTNKEFFETLQQVLLRCWVAGFMVLIVWFLAILGLGDAILQMHGLMFGLTRHELDLIMYCGMGLTKLVVLVCFFLPWLSIKRINKSVKN